MKKLLALLLLLASVCFGQQYLYPDANALIEWEYCTYTTIDESSYDDNDFSYEASICNASLNVKVYDGVILKGNYNPTLTADYQIFTFSFTAPASNSNNLKIRFTVSGEDCEGLYLTKMFQVTVSDPPVTPGTGTYYCRFRSKLVPDEQPGAPPTIFVSWTQIEVPSGSSTYIKPILVIE